MQSLNGKSKGICISLQLLSHWQDTSWLYVLSQCSILLRETQKERVIDSMLILENEVNETVDRKCRQNAWIERKVSYALARDDRCLI